jgi:uncharacterized cupin superfamily protein
MSQPEPKPEPPIAIDSIPWTDWGEGERFALRYRVLSNTREKGRKIGVSYEELPPGKQTAPFHYHLVEEEHIIALEGEATLRLGNERYRIKAGDYVGFPAGQRAGHCLINEGEKPFRYIMIGDRAPHEIVFYPDSKKVMLRSPGKTVFMREGEPLDYWDGEKVDEPVKPPK